LEIENEKNENKKKKFVDSMVFFRILYEIEEFQ